MIIKTPIDLELTQMSGQTSQPPWLKVDNSFNFPTSWNIAAVLWLAMNQLFLM